MDKNITLTTYNDVYISSDQMKTFSILQKEKEKWTKKNCKKIDFWSLFDALPTEENTDNFFLATFHLIF